MLFTLLLHQVGVRQVRRPIQQLAARIEQLESADFHFEAEVGRADELGWLAARFARLAERLQATVIRLVRAEKQASAYAT